MRARPSPARSSPTVQPLRPAGLASALSRNLDAMAARRRTDEERAPIQDKIADAVTRFAGSMTFVVVHLVLFGLWVPVNLGLLPVVPPFDSTFVILGTTASCEAIFLSTFVLISQNRMMEAADKRADLDLQINLLSEHEVTKIVALVAAIAERLGIDVREDGEIEELKMDVAPEAVLDGIERRAKEPIRSEEGAHPCFSFRGGEAEPETHRREGRRS